MNKQDNNFKLERDDLNLTQQDTAMLLGVSRVTYIKWENNPDAMPVGKFEKLMSEFARLRHIKENEIE